MQALRPIAAGLFSLLALAAALAQSRVEIASPDGRIKLALLPAGVSSADLRYAVDFAGKRLIEESKLGLEIEGQSPLGRGMHLTASRSTTVDESYSIPVGKTSIVRNHYNDLTADFADPSARRLTIEVRAFDDGLAFRYSVPEQPSIGQVKILRENTEFQYAKDAQSYPLIVDGFQSAYEDAYQLRNITGLHPDWLIALPFLANEPGVGWVAITEADIEDYAGMYLEKSAHWGDRILHAELPPRLDASGNPVPGGGAVATRAPFESPWRVLMIADEPGKLIESNIILNLNPSAKIADTSWIVAGKAAWDWWSGEAAPGVSFKTGMNTATMKHYIDFAAASGFPYMLIDAGWAPLDPTAPKNEPRLMDITRTIPEIDMPELLRYAREKGVKLWLWAHWTSVNKYMDQAFPLFEKWGIAGVKIDFMNRDDQWMVAWYRRVVANAAEHHLMIDFHGAFKPDGLRRTYPNLMTREAVMGKEYLRVSARTTPAHNATLPFTRMLAGPMDYTPGAFGNSNLENFVARSFMPMGLGTRAQELALYVLFESPLQMVSDYPEHYAGQKEFDFIKRVPTTWDEVHSIGGMPMQWVSLARRSHSDWYVGAITNWEERNIKIPLSFLGPGAYVAEIYSDAPDAATEATHTVLNDRSVDHDTVLDVHMVSGGGTAMWIHPAAHP
jgi:alpha-glucosidase